MSAVTLKRSSVLGFALVMAIVVAHAQIGIKQNPPLPETANGPVPLCESDAIDSTFAFRDQPAGEQTVTLYFLNKGNTACGLKDPPNPSFAVDGHSMDVTSCPFCGHDGKPIPTSNRLPAYWVVLTPGASAAIDMNWASVGESCQWADWAMIFFNWTEGNDWRKAAGFDFIPSGWPLRICSQVRSFGYRTEVDPASIRAQKDSTLLVSLLQTTVYSDERATLHVVLARPDQSSEKSTGCASLYTVRYIPPLRTRLDPLHTVGSVRVDSYTPEQIREDKERAWPQWRKDLRRECDIAAGALSADAEIGATELATVTHIEWRTNPGPGRDPIFFTAATHFTVLDVDTLPPNWGTTEKGIRAGLSVDRTKFAVGELVPLHIRWEDLNATASLGQGECHEPGPDLEIQNSEHQVLRTLPADAGCMGHGFGPFVFPKGTVQHDFRELTTASPPHLPSVTPFPPSLPGSGIYYLVSVWSPRVLDISDTASGTFPIAAGMGEVYGTARSLPVRIEVVPGSNP